MKTDPLTAAVRRALQSSPCSVSALAQEAGVPQSTLSRITAGKLSATPDVAESVTAALQSWGSTCQRLAKDIATAGADRKGR